MPEQPVPTKVLIADDSPVVLHMLEKMFTGTGFAVITARDGLEAVEQALGNDVGLIILDVMMPRMNGYQACRLLKSDPLTRGVPVIILTSKDQPGDRFWGLQTGADHFLTKDEAPGQLLQLVAAALAKARTVAPLQTAKARTSFDILSRVNDLLDRQLYEATVLSEIGSVARHLVRFDETVSSVAGLIARVVDFSLGAVAFVDGEDLDVMFVIHHPVSPEAIEAVGERLAGEARDHMCGTLGEVRTRLLTLSSAGDERFAEDTLDDLLTYPIITNGCLVGMIAVAGEGLKHLTVLDRALLERVANQAHIVVENSRLIERLRNLSIRDGLTELFNHRHIMETVTAEFERACRYGSPMSLMMLDIDHFKRVNDQHGHQVGDIVLRDVARLLTGALRSVDSVGRYGGEEFLVVLPHTGYDETRRTAERLRRLVGEHRFRASDKDLRVTVSIGLAAHPHGAKVEGASDLLRVADRALYRAKESGRNRVVGAGDEGARG